MNNPTDIDDQALARRAARGDALAFETLVRRHEQYVYNLALRVLGNEQDAEDAAQQAFLRAWRGLPAFRGEARFSTWLYRIVTNTCCNLLPRIRKDLAVIVHDEEAELLADERQSVEPALLTAEERYRLDQALNSLPECSRLLLTLRHLQEMSYEEISQVTGMPLGTVKTGIFRARQRLKHALGSVEVEYGFNG